MKCENNIRECPEGWTSCDLCANLQACNDGTYTPEPEPPEPEIIPEMTPGPEELTTDLGIVIPRERGTWFDEFMKMSINDRMAEVMKYHPENLHAVADPYKHETGAIVPGGGSKSKCKKSKKGNKPTVYVWGETL